MIIGAHVSTAGGLPNCFANAEKIGATAIQIFGASPRQWATNMPDDSTVKAFRQTHKDSGLGPVFLHAAYLVNIGSPNPDFYTKSIQSLTDHLKIAELLGAEGLIYHIGSYKDSTLEESNKRIVDGMHQVLKNAPGLGHLIMENSAGGGNKIGLTLEEIAHLHKSAAHDRIKVCIDTAHAFGAGLLKDYSLPELKSFTKKFDSLIGLPNLTVLHINDSRVPYDSKKDRHENIGQGEIGLPAFQNLAATPYLNTLPWILEVPGEGAGPNEENVNILKALKNQ